MRVPNDVDCATGDGDLRCHCGRLMARLTSGGIEIKCQRCKRVVLLPAPPLDGRWVTVPPR